MVAYVHAVCTHWPGSEQVFDIISFQEPTHWNTVDAASNYPRVLE